jgi:hypothetical protein
MYYFHVRWTQKQKKWSLKSRLAEHPTHQVLMRYRSESISDIAQIHFIEGRGVSIHTEVYFSKTPRGIRRSQEAVANPYTLSRPNGTQAKPY